MVGKLVSKVKLPSILGWLITGMVLGPHALSLINQQLLDAQWYQTIVHILECGVGLMIGTELVWNKIKRSGKAIVITTLTQSLGTFLIVSLVFAIVFEISGIPIYLAFIFGGIALATAPAPECANIVQGTIAAAAVINEIIAVITAKKGFEWAGEMNHATSRSEDGMQHTIITISRQHGSGGRKIGRKVAAQLGIPFYDREIVEQAAKDSHIDIRFFENSETKDAGSLIYDLSEGSHLMLPITDRVYLQQVKTIRDIAAKGGCVIVGRCADAILADHPHILRVFVYADSETRRARVEAIYHEPASDLDQLEKKRCSYYQHYTGKCFGEAQNYDLCLNSDSLGLNECVKAICSAYRNHTDALHKEA